MFDAPETRNLTLGRYLCQVRTGAGVSQRELSLALGEDPGYISRIEYGLRTIDVVEFIRITGTLRRNSERALRNFMDLEQKPRRRPAELPLLPTF